MAVDFKPPVVRSFEFKPGLVDIANGTGAFSIKLNVADALSGVEYVAIWVTSPAGKHAAAANIWNFTGSDRNRIYNETFTVNKYLDPGKYTVQLSLSDKAGNTAYYDLRETLYVTNGADGFVDGRSYYVGANKSLGAGLDNLYLSGTGNFTGTGNAAGNRVGGNAGNNRLFGLEGDDTLNGNGGNDALIGGAGADQMSGGTGDDAFSVDNAGDRVVEVAGQGTDTVYASVSYVLAAGQHIERFATTLITGTAAIRLTGNELGQTISGNNGANIIAAGGGNDTLLGYGGNDTLNGGDGNDVVYGGVGNDTLTGGAGYDYFAFNTGLSPSTNVDRIMDFNIVQDTIRLDNAVMPGLGVTLGTLSAAKFWKSTAGVAHDADDRIIYDIDTGRLFYDGNGNIAGGAVHFATLSPNLAITNADFVVF